MPSLDPPIPMLADMNLENEKYVLFTTFRRDGRAVSTPVWLVQMPDGEFGFSTGSESGKAKRLRHTPRVTLQGCDRSGGDAHGPVYDAALGVAESVAKRIGAKRFGSERVGVVIRLNAG
jgi:PPOX class probable F420-dependent enzyme